jgi:hypothetical protein
MTSAWCVAGRAPTASPAPRDIFCKVEFSLFIMRTYMCRNTFWPGERPQEEFRSGANLVKILEKGVAKTTSFSSVLNR